MLKEFTMSYVDGNGYHVNETVVANDAMSALNSYLHVHQDLSSANVSVENTCNAREFNVHNCN